MAAKKRAHLVVSFYTFVVVQHPPFLSPSITFNSELRSSPRSFSQSSSHSLIFTSKVRVCGRPGLELPESILHEDT